MSSLIIQRVGLRFLAHLLKINSRHSMELTKAERIDTWVRNQEQENFSRVGLSESHRSDKHTEAAGLSDASKYLVGFWVRVFCREHVFQGLKMPFGIGLSEDIILHVGLMLGWWTREHVFRVVFSLLDRMIRREYFWASDKYTGAMISGRWFWNSNFS